MREVCPENHECAGNGHEETEPESASGTLAEDQPGEQADKNGSVIAEQGGIGGGGLQNRSVVEGEIEGEEEAAEGDDAEGAHVQRRAAALEEKRWQQDYGGNQHAIEGRGWAGNVGPADENGGPGDADYAAEEREVCGQAFAACGCGFCDDSFGCQDESFSV